MSAVELTSFSSVALSAGPAVSPAGQAPALDGVSGERSVLPAAEPLARAGLNDAMGMLYEVLSTQRQLDVQSGQSQITMDHEKRDKAVADRLAALKRQMADDASSGDGFFSSIGHFFEDIASDAGRGRFDLLVDDAGKDIETAWNSPAFWKDLEEGAMIIGKAALAVGGAVATVVTAGTAAPLLIAAALALSGGGLVVSQTACADGILGRGASQWLGLALEVGGSLVSAGASVAAAGGQAVAASGQSAGTQTAAALEAAVDVAGRSLEVVAGAAKFRSGSFAADGQRASTDATIAMQHVARLDRLVASLTETIQQGDHSHQRAQTSLRSAIAIGDQTSVSATTLALKG
ncbi:MAG: hypothetical protein M3O50_20330 [Myxococcota bacterium]|nr:hypothetical protein [Myxococcota bacterium]